MNIIHVINTVQNENALDIEMHETVPGLKASFGVLTDELFYCFKALSTLSLIFVSDKERKFSMVVPVD